MASDQVVETSVNTNNSPSQDYTTNPDDHSNHNINPLSQEGGEGLLQLPPFRIFPRTIVAFLLGLPYHQFTHPLSRYPCIYEKKFQNLLPWKKLGGGGRAATTPPSWEGTGWQQK